MENLSTYFCGYWKGFGAQQALLVVKKKLKKKFR